MARIPIRLYGDPVLRLRASEVEEIDEGLRRLAADMVETMRDAEGVGLAANQVGELRRVIVVDFKPVTDEDRTEALINPRIITREGDLAIQEGCLSIPGVNEEIKRSARIQVAYLDLAGEARTLEGDGYMSAVFQHEIDHLDGVLITDRISPVRKGLIRGVLKRITRDAESGHRA
jgi:peptide deformylase